MSDSFRIPLVFASVTPDGRVCVRSEAMADMSSQLRREVERRLVFDEEHDIWLLPKDEDDARS